MHKLLFWGFLAFCSLGTFAQDRDYAMQIVKDLSGKDMNGRGYVNDGSNKAGKYLAKEMKSIGLQAFDVDYAQKYHFDVNSFPGKMLVKVDGKKLKAGLDYVVHPRLSTQKGRYELLYLPDSITQKESIYKVVDTANLNGKMIVVPPALQKYFWSGFEGIENAIFLFEKCTWAASHREPITGICLLQVRQEAFPTCGKEIKIDFDSKYLQDFEAENIIGYVEGNTCPDSTIVFTAHYDHLGQMGKKCYFPGASDNATGTAFVLSMAKYYAEHPEEARYTMIFALLSGEEVGIYGSLYNSEHPQWDLEKTRLLINMDMVGSGSEGITIVNSTVFPEITAVLKRINEREKLIPKITDREESCNSDHCPYYEKGVPAFFIYTCGPESKEYHSVTDTYQKIQFTIFEVFFSLMKSFVEEVKAPVFNR
jgi:Predicted aminopeptidases